MFRQFLTFLAENTDARRINILAHSAGAPIAVEAVKQLRLLNYYEDAAAVQAKYRIGQFVLVAPDMDLLQFVNAAFPTDHPERVRTITAELDAAASTTR